MNQTSASGFENLIGYYEPQVQVLSLSLIESFSDLLPIYMNVIDAVLLSSVIAYCSIQF
jgi:hypothetical protein